MNLVKLSAFLLCSTSFPKESTDGLYVSDGGTFEPVKFVSGQVKAGQSVEGLIWLIAECLTNLKTDDYRNVQIK